MPERTLLAVVVKGDTGAQKWHLEPGLVDQNGAMAIAYSQESSHACNPSHHGQSIVAVFYHLEDVCCAEPAVLRAKFVAIPIKEELMEVVRLRLDRRPGQERYVVQCIQTGVAAKRRSNGKALLVYHRCGGRRCTQLRLWQYQQLQHSLSRTTWHAACDVRSLACTPLPTPPVGNDENPRQDERQ